MAIDPFLVMGIGSALGLVGANNAAAAARRRAAQLEAMAAQIRKDMMTIAAPFLNRAAEGYSAAAGAASVFRAQMSQQSSAIEASRQQALGSIRREAAIARASAERYAAALGDVSRSEGMRLRASEAVSGSIAETEIKYMAAQEEGRRTAANKYLEAASILAGAGQIGASVASKGNELYSNMIMESQKMRAEADMTIPSMITQFGGQVFGLGVNAFAAGLAKPQGTQTTSPTEPLIGTSTTPTSAQTRSIAGNFGSMTFPAPAAARNPLQLDVGSTTLGGFGSPYRSPLAAASSLANMSNEVNVYPRIGTFGGDDDFRQSMKSYFEKYFRL